MSPNARTATVWRVFDISVRVNFLHLPFEIASSPDFRKRSCNFPTFKVHFFASASWQMHVDQSCAFRVISRQLVSNDTWSRSKSRGTRHLLTDNLCVAARLSETILSLSYIYSPPLHLSNEVCENRYGCLYDVDVQSNFISKRNRSSWCRASVVFYDIFWFQHALTHAVANGATFCMQISKDYNRRSALPPVLLRLKTNLSRRVTQICWTTSKVRWSSFCAFCKLV